jgi:predicted O-methyltransferase YrrM
MDFIVKYIRNIPGLREVIRIYSRRKRAIGPYKEKLRLARSWPFKRTEFSNYYYSLTERNKKDLAFTISQITKTPLAEVEAYFYEIDTNQDVSDILLDFRKNRPELRDSNMQIARRIGWYAFIRIVRPKLVIETGVHHGIGALVICAALRKNCEETFLGSYLGTDINPAAGQLLKYPFSEFGRIVIGDSVETLQKNESQIDIFINDSDHSVDYEMKEYNTISSQLSQHSIILGDNSGETDALREFSQTNNRDFLYFREEPYNHFYTGGGIGISYKSELLLKHISKLR